MSCETELQRAKSSEHVDDREPRFYLHELEQFKRVSKEILNDNRVIRGPWAERSKRLNRVGQRRHVEARKDLRGSTEAAYEAFCHVP